MDLIIVESPSKIKTIEKFLGKDYKVLSSKGHIKDLKTNGKFGLGIDIDNNFTPNYKIIDRQKKQISELKKEAKKANNIYLATDPDREGEAIAYNLLEELKLDINDKNRIVFNEITKSAVTEALKNPTKININLVESQKTRRVLDRIIGFRLSQILRNKIKSDSAGRVQSAALLIIKNKEDEIKNFKPETYYSLIISVNHGKNTYKLNEVKINNFKKYDPEKIKIAFESIESLKVKDIIIKETKGKSKIPYITSSLQQDAYNKLGFSVKKTMSVAQKLYEGININGQKVGLITYMRTDSKRYSQTYLDQANKFINKKFGKEYFLKSKATNSKNNVQDAHEAIRVTNLDLDANKIKNNLENDEYKLYDLIYKRSLSSLMKPPIYKNHKIIFENDFDLDIFYTYNKTLFKGFLEVENEKSKLELEAKKGETLNIEEKEFTKEQTKPPAKYNESSLVKKLEELGIGRPSTYASVISTLVSRSYVDVDKKRFSITDKGINSINFLIKYFSNIISLEYTAKMESELDNIASSKNDYLTLISKFWDKFNQEYELANKNAKKIEPVILNRKCPLCSHDLVERTSRNNQKFIGCSNFPECHFIENIKDDIEKLNYKCKKCKKGIIVKKVTKKGKVFYGCNRYPKCDQSYWEYEIKKELKEKNILNEE